MEDLVQVTVSAVPQTNPVEDLVKQIMEKPAVDSVEVEGDTVAVETDHLDAANVVRTDT